MSIMDTILIGTEELYAIIETYPLHPMCEWHPPTNSTDDRRKLFVNVYHFIQIYIIIK